MRALPWRPRGMEFCIGARFHHPSSFIFLGKYGDCPVFRRLAPVIRPEYHEASTIASFRARAECAAARIEA